MKGGRGPAALPGRPALPYALRPNPRGGLVPPAPARTDPRTMQDERLEPGTHLRKNNKQVHAMLRAATTRAGFVWDVVAETGSSLTVAIRPGEGADAAAQAEVRFTTDGVEFTATPNGGEAREARALYTDTRWMMETLEGLLSELGA